jgi:hypothetical protein
MNLKTRNFTGAEILNEPPFAVDESVIADSEDKIYKCDIENWKKIQL